MFQRKTLIPAVIIPLFVGLSGFLRLIGEPSFAAIRKVDVVQLTGSGACFGVSFMALMILWRSPRR